MSCPRCSNCGERDWALNVTCSNLYCLNCGEDQYTCDEPAIPTWAAIVSVLSVVIFFVFEFYGFEIWEWIS